MYHDNLLSTKHLYKGKNYCFVGEPPVLAFLGYQVDVVKAVSLPFPAPKALSPEDRRNYQEAVSKVRSFYREGGGVWWSSDSRGRHRHNSIKGREAEHEKLCSKLLQEWMTLLKKDLPDLSEHSSQLELNSHSAVTQELERWHRARIAQEHIMVGSDSDHLESLLYQYLEPSLDTSVVAGRSLFTSDSGRIGITSKHTQPGDIVVYFAASQTAKMLRRRENPNEASLKPVVQKAFGDIYPNVYEDSHAPIDGEKSITYATAKRTMTIQHSIIIGDCYIEGAPGCPIEPQEQPCLSIFALR